MQKLMLREDRYIFQGHTVVNGKASVPSQSCLFSMLKLLIRGNSAFEAITPEDAQLTNLAFTYSTHPCTQMSLEYVLG